MLVCCSAHLYNIVPKEIIIIQSESAVLLGKVQDGEPADTGNKCTVH